MKHRPLAICLLGSLSIVAPAAFTQTSDHTKDAGLDPDGAIYVGSPGGERIRVAEPGHCVEAMSPDNQTFVCEIERGVIVEPPTVFTQLSSDHLEIFYSGGRRNIIDSGGLIRDLHFWDDGAQIVVQAIRPDKSVVYTRYDLASATLIESVPEPTDTKLLPQWAKSQSQLDDESVIETPEADQERMNWIAKVLNEVGKLHPAMKRSDLSPLFTTEGGLSFPGERTYVYAKCPYIKIHVKFKPVSDNNTVEGSPDDVIESISTPFLEFAHVD